MPPVEGTASTQAWPLVRLAADPHNKTPPCSRIAPCPPAAASRRPGPSRSATTLPEKEGPSCWSLHIRSLAVI